MADGEWALLEDFAFASDLLGRRIVARRGFCTDFESFLFGIQNGPARPQAGVIHDWLTRTHDTDEDTAARVYLEALLTTGLHPVWAEQRYAAVLGPLGRDAWESGPMRLRVVAV